MNELLGKYKSERIHRQGNSILIVDDDLDIRQLFQLFLEDAGFVTYSASNGEEALKLLAQIPKPSLIILDLQMPVMNGWDFAKRLSEDPLFSKIPIIATTASDDSRGLKCEDFVRKPLDLFSLLPTIKHYFFRGLFAESEDADFEHHVQLKQRIHD